MHNCILDFILRRVCRPFVALCNGLLPLGILQCGATTSLGWRLADGVHVRMDHDHGTGKTG